MKLTLAERFERMTQPVPPSTCVLWLGATRGRPWATYGVMWVDGKLRPAHCVGYFLKHGCYPSNYGCHTCDVTLCVNGDHVYDGTHESNMADMRSRGRSNRDARNGRCIHSQETIDRVRAASGSLRDIAAQFGLSFGYVGSLKRLQNRKG